MSLLPKKWGGSFLQSLWSLGEPEMLHGTRCMGGNMEAVTLLSLRNSWSEGSDPKRSPGDLTNPSGLVKR